MKGYNTSAVQWELNWNGGRKDDVRTGSVMKKLGVHEVKGKLCFQARHVAGVDNSLVDLIACWEHNMINAGLKHRRPNFYLGKQVMTGKNGKYSAIVGVDRSSGLLRR